MDYPKRIPNVGLVGGKFVDENVSTGLPGSLIPSAWGNAVTDELLNVIKAAGIAPSEDNNAQLLQAIQGLSASDVKRAVRVATTGPIALSGLQTIDGVALATGDRVLVKDQANASQNWIYTASANSWSRALDANEDAECVPGHLIIVQAGTSYAGTMWQLTNTLPPQVGTTTLTFAMLFGKTGVVPGEYRKVSVDALGRVISGSNPTTLSGHGITDAYTKSQADEAANSLVQAAVNRLVDSAPGALDTLKELAAALGNDPNFATTVLNALAAKADNAFMVAELGKRLLVSDVSQQRPRLASSENTGDWRSTGLELREVQQVGEWNPLEVRDEFGPGISFHWGGKYAAKLHMNVAGVLIWNGNPLATLNNPVFVGAPQADTAPFGTDTKQIANTSFVQSAVRNAASQTLGVGQTWQDVRASRAANVTYTNTTGRPIMVTLSQSNHLGLLLKYTINGLEVIWSSSGGQTGISDAASFLVPHGSTYSCNFLTATWLELR
ncbi:hypothetical protein OC926_17810 [Pseudomonas peradeniyensis]|uniref:hypothetical protein n=1 Tax=Pseudomonas peradeniyensis TaxID=2745488 RepID=UPI0021D4CA18|nr:hypothetical protein [Pseudomonas peradeniyensis]MCU7281709.1 hypothetical protein [Pseudomonas peradeniyensis]